MRSARCLHPVRAAFRAGPAPRHRRYVVYQGIAPCGAPNAFTAVSDEQSFFDALNAECEKGRIPKQLLPLWEDFFANYKKAILSADLPTHDMKLVSEMQAAIADTVLNQMANPYKFPSKHEGITKPYDYFEFGQKYVGSLIDFTKSWVGHRERFDQIEAQLKAGENAIILANHQSEADPGIWAHMLMHTHPDLAKQIIYVAGDRVVSDPLCVPFSLGRNLFCVHSKRHIDDDPATKDEKAATNRQTLRNMGLSMASGGTLLWIAPAGGRDRPGDDNVYVPAQFDVGSVDLMRALASKVEKRTKRKTHLYPFAMYSAPLMPPPKVVEKGVGEWRMVNFTGVGISLGGEIDADASTAGLTDKAEISEAFAGAVYERVCALYAELDAAVKDPGAAPAHFTQPWLAEMGSDAEQAMQTAALDGSASRAHVASKPPPGPGAILQKVREALGV
jgi:glycerol-3-phosphate O-acyltransferase